MSIARFTHWVRSASLQAYPELVYALGANPMSLLREHGLTAKLLANPETRLPLLAVNQLLERSAHVTQRPDFGLLLASRRDFTDLGPISVVLKEEKTPRDAINTLLRYMKLLNAALVSHTEEVAGKLVIHERIVSDQGGPVRQSTEFAVAVVFKTVQELVSPEWRPVAVCFTHRPPSDLSLHRRFFGCDVQFNSDFNGFVCMVADLNKETHKRQTTISKFARSYLEDSLNSYQNSSIFTIRQLVLALLPAGRCTAKQVAAHLGVDRRTLHRHLEVEGVTFKLLLERIRSELAIEHLRDSDMSMSDISAILGFSSSSAFSHWFRDTFYCSPLGWRKKSRSTAASELHDTTILENTKLSEKNSGKYKTQ